MLCLITNTITFTCKMKTACMRTSAHTLFVHAYRHIDTQTRTGTTAQTGEMEFESVPSHRSHCHQCIYVHSALYVHSTLLIYTYTAPYVYRWHASMNILERTTSSGNDNDFVSLPLAPSRYCSITVTHKCAQHHPHPSPATKTLLQKLLRCTLLTTPHTGHRVRRAKNDRGLSLLKRHSETKLKFHNSGSLVPLVTN